ncbi:NAD(+) synthase [Garciella nitratireducens]|uniref:Glutamine-dependent NAD(+) synthetase n=1 Tax=Garciella nitratireducens DSM 15102 TaxID=1121911 RepID=A0A1T4KYI0_9FIRM|nr:NAD(+) synthase [Garciella nitratireducens]SJZ47479.1 NAD+ synthase (glutamine-hydrolysing) [Garciella nitratireducens DSM 15102]
MHSKGYVRIATITPIIQVANCEYNQSQIIKTLQEAISNDTELAVYPELCVSGYTCADLFFQNTLLQETENAVKALCEFLKDYKIFVVIGAPVQVQGKLYNCAIIINKGKILGIIPKKYLANHNEFCEKRWFTSGFYTKGTHKICYAGQEVLFGCDLLFQHKNIPSLIVGIEICEDLWACIPPSSFYCEAGATVILNPSSSNAIIGKSNYRKTLIQQQSARCLTAYAYASSGFGESSTDLVFDGQGLIYENGHFLKESSRFSLSNMVTIADIDLDRILHDRLNSNCFKEYFPLKDKETEYTLIEFETYDKEHKLMREISPHPFIPESIEDQNKVCEEIFSIQTIGLAQRIRHIGCPTIIIGISGGLDSTLALLACVKTCDLLEMDRGKILAVTMPGFGTTDRTYQNALTLMKKLGVTIKEISIQKACIQHFQDIGHDISIHDATYENTQARERTQILMDLANKYHGIVVGTGDLSELALGWATYNGDHMSMYSVNSGIPKTLVRYLVRWIADGNINKEVKDALYDILDTPVSPELLPPDIAGNIAQKTEETIGPYELHDFFLFYIIRYGYSPKKIYYLACIAFKETYCQKTILKWLKSFYKRFFSQQFKRSCLPDGPKVGSISLSPRGSWKMPSDASFHIWFKQLQEIEKDCNYSN